MTDSTEPKKFTDVNETVGEEWEAETTPYGRVRTVISNIYTPISAESAAEDARTTPKTARKHLNALADEGFVSTETGKNGGTYYSRSPESLVVEQAADILEHTSVDELINRIAEMQQTISDFQADYGVESPEELIINQTNRVLADVANQEDISHETIREWQTTRRNLAFANAALAITNAKRFVDSNSSGPGGSIPVQ